MPEIIEKFLNQHPTIKVNVQQMTPIQIVEAVSAGKADIGVSPVRGYTSQDTHVLRCREYERVIVVPKNHALLKCANVTLAEVVKYPIVTYVFGFTGRSKLDEACVQGQLLLQSIGNQDRHDETVDTNDTSHDNGYNV